MASVQFARAYGMTVLGTAGSEPGLKLVSQVGAHQVFNHRQEGYTDRIMVSTDWIMVSTDSSYRVSVVVQNLVTSLVSHSTGKTHPPVLLKLIVSPKCGVSGFGDKKMDLCPE